MIAQLWDWISKTNPDAWAAGAGWTTTAIALVASIAALRQVREARRLREEQAQPYVVAYMEHSQADMQFLDLVIKNFGTTAARDVRIYAQPTLKRSTGQGADTEDVGLFKALPILVPQQEWRTFWDSGLNRKRTNLPDEHVVKVEYKDARGRKMEPTVAALDWSVYKNSQWLAIYGPHHSAKALREIKDAVKKWGERGGGGLSVYARSGDRKDARLRNEFERRRRSAAELHKKMLPAAAVAAEGSEVADAEITPAPPSQAESPKQERMPDPPPSSAQDVEQRRDSVASKATGEGPQQSTSARETEQ
ncbi:hypothetical protein E1258_03305 [Micromonospora sp. KC207]|uniref:hypothetical protein n=1 Tax=Micromonospora sp. KC207 TaxID=2530377 RepID=UPI00104CC1AE|nr:hypothetical protein [Micromonospora sp. KC207]TDC66262.1 hypothetical protein E1258_03305 [Micromonospora sp. KC207]